MFAIATDDESGRWTEFGVGVLRPDPETEQTRVSILDDGPSWLIPSLAALDGTDLIFITELTCDGEFGLTQAGLVFDDGLIHLRLGLGVFSVPISSWEEAVAAWSEDDSPERDLGAEPWPDGG